VATQSCGSALGAAAISASRSGGIKIKRWWPFEIAT
jgi:hypothetical protein